MDRIDREKVWYIFLFVKTEFLKEEEAWRQNFLKEEEAQRIVWKIH